MNDGSNQLDQSYSMYGNNFLSFNSQRYLIPEIEQNLPSNFMEENCSIFLNCLLHYPEDLIGPLFVYGYSSVKINWKKFYNDNMNDITNTQDYIQQFKQKLQNKYTYFMKWCYSIHSAFFFHQRRYIENGKKDKNDWPKSVILWEILLKKSVDNIIELENNNNNSVKNNNDNIKNNNNNTLIEDEEKLTDIKPVINLKKRKLELDPEISNQDIISNTNINDNIEQSDKDNNKKKRLTLDNMDACNKLNELINNNMILKEYQKEVEKLYLLKINLLTEKNNKLETENIRLKTENIKLRTTQETIRKMLDSNL